MYNENYANKAHIREVPLAMSIEVSLPRPQRRRMQTLLRKTKSRIVALRCCVLLLLHDGHSAAEVATRVGCVRATVYRTAYRYEDLGEHAVHDQRLLAYLDDVPNDYGWDRSNWTLELLALQLAADTQVEVSCSYVYQLLRRRGCRRGRPRPGLRIPVRGRRKTLEKIENLVSRASAEDEVFCQDEADVHLNPKIGSTYLKPGQQPVVLTPGKNVKRYIFGALKETLNKSIHGLFRVGGRKRGFRPPHKFNDIRRRIRRCIHAPHGRSDLFRPSLMHAPGPSCTPWPSTRPRTYFASS